MYKIYLKLKFIMIKLAINFYSKFKTINSPYRIAIMSSNEWKGRILEDIRLKYHLSKIGIKSDIVSWQNFSSTNYNAVVIRSVWGFCPTEFVNLFKKIDGKVKIINELNLVIDNLSKDHQYHILDKYNIKHVKTNSVINSEMNMNLIQKFLAKYKTIVVKPDISESGKDTFLISNIKYNDNTISPQDFFNKKLNHDLFLVQPFYNQIECGELSVIVVNNKITHAVNRFPGVLNKKVKVKEVPISSLDDAVIDIVHKIIEIPEYSNLAYIRIDFLKSNKEFLVLELEVIDPCMFFDSIDDKKRRNDCYKSFAASIKSQLVNK